MSWSWGKERKETCCRLCARPGSLHPCSFVRQDGAGGCHLFISYNWMPTETVITHTRQATQAHLSLFIIRRGVLIMMSASLFLGYGWGNWVNKVWCGQCNICLEGKCVKRDFNKWCTFAFLSFPGCWISWVFSLWDQILSFLFFWTNRIPGLQSQLVFLSYLPISRCSQNNGPPRTWLVILNSVKREEPNIELGLCYVDCIIITKGVVKGRVTMKKSS